MHSFESKEAAGKAYMQFVHEITGKPSLKIGVDKLAPP